MACFLVPAAEAIVTTAANHVMKKRGTDAEMRTAPAHGIHFADKLNWLSNMLWGGSALLAFEHVWHGEVTPWFPFLTAAGNPAELAEMLQEMATSGVGMATLVTVVWGGMVVAANRIVQAKPEGAE